MPFESTLWNKTGLIKWNNDIRLNLIRSRNEFLFSFKMFVESIIAIRIFKKNTTNSFGSLERCKLWTITETYFSRATMRGHWSIAHIPLLFILMAYRWNELLVIRIIASYCILSIDSEWNLLLSCEKKQTSQCLHIYMCDVWHDSRQTMVNNMHKNFK